MEFTTYHSLPDAARQIREAVFVREQGFQLEFDKTDETAVHIVAWTERSPPAPAGCIRRKGASTSAEWLCCPNTGARVWDGS